MIDDLIDRLNLLYRKYVLDEQNFTEGDEIRKIFKEIKELGYSVFTALFEPKSIEIDKLPDEAKEKFNNMMAARQEKLDNVEKQNFEAASDHRDIERQLKREFLFEYMKQEGVAYFKISDREGKTIYCHMYCEVMKAIFKIQ